jgi:hypothetical protein
MATVIAMAILVMASTSASVLSAEEEARAGSIYVVGESGLSVFLDGALVGMTSDKEKGLVLLDVAPGEHDVRVVKPGGFKLQQFKVTVEVGAAVEVKVGEFKSGDEQASQKPAKRSSRMVVRRAGEVKARRARPTTTDGAEVDSDSDAEQMRDSTEAVSKAASEPAAAEASAKTRFNLQYQARGTSIEQGLWVKIWRLPEDGGEPVVALDCRRGPWCMVPEKTDLEPGTHRFKIAFRHITGRPPDRKLQFENVQLLDLEAEEGGTYTIDARYGGDDPDLCRVDIVTYVTK